MPQPLQKHVELHNEHEEDLTFQTLQFLQVYLSKMFHMEENEIMDNF